MSKSYRIRTKVGVDTSLKVLIEQEFEHLEILSLKILQSDIYTRQCSDYGVIIGRVSVNNGFGVPNAKISIFIPIDSEDQKNPIISELYPYKSLLDNNSDGYRYNLLPYVKSYSEHIPTGTFFTRNDVLKDPTLIEVYDKYYKYNAVTNQSGDYMIFGVPVGSHTIVMDVDLSDIGEFSLSPQDLIRMGLATESQVSGTNFKSSHNLRELPQIINLSKSIEVEPLWGQPEICNLGITRTDFDLSSESKIDIRPTAVFMGSIISDSNTNALKSNCKPTNKSGYLCSLIAGPGEILSIRQTINQDSNGLPILENFSLESGGKVIDENGAWLIDVPMNLDYYITNEFGEQVLSNDPEVGIPTKSKYRFKVKWSQSPSLSDVTKRAYYLVPNIREYPEPFNLNSYSFSVDWNDYGNSQMIQDAINCDDKFYLMQYNKVYTISEFIDNHKYGSGTERYIGIKNILEDTCESDNNKFPTNDGTFRFDIIYIIFMFFSVMLTPIFFSLILLLHILYFVAWLTGIILSLVIVVVGSIVVLLCNFVKLIVNVINSIPYVSIGDSPDCPDFEDIKNLIKQVMGLKDYFKNVKVPILTYPDCNLCSCEQGEGINEPSDPDGWPNTEVGKLTPCDTISSDPKPMSTLNNGMTIAPLSTFSGFKLPTYNIQENPTGFNGQRKTIFANDFAGYTYDGQYGSSTIGAPFLQLETITTGSGGNSSTEVWNWFTNGLPLADRINLFNVKAKYFDENANNPGGGVNRISVNFQPTQPQVHYDNTIVILCDKTTAKKFAAGQMISFQNPSFTKDPNLTGGIKNKYNNYAITGTTFTGNNTTVQVNYSRFDGNGYTQSPVYVVNITADTTNNYHKFPIDIEYFQVITGMTYNQFNGQCSTQLPNSLNEKYFNNDTTFFQLYNNTNGYVAGYRGFINIETFGQTPLTPSGINVLNSMTYVKNVNDNYVVILNRGVDPYTNKIDIEYGIGKLLGYSSESEVKVRGLYRMNIPIQGSYKNISHNSSDRAITTPTSPWTPLSSTSTQNYVDGLTWVGGNSVPVGGNVNNETGYAGQQLYFNSFSYCDNQKETWGWVTGYTQGLTATTWTQKTSRFSGFNSNLISYYSSLDNRSLNYKPTCNNIQPGNGTTNTGDDVPLFSQTPPLSDGAIADTFHGLCISLANGFTYSWSRTPTYHYQLQTCVYDDITGNNCDACGCWTDSNGDCVNWSLPWMTRDISQYYTTTGKNEGYIPNEIVEGGSMLHMMSIIPTSPLVVDCCSDICSYPPPEVNVKTFYYSPIYDTTGNTMNFTLGSIPSPTFISFPNMTENQIVMRGDRLPTSTNVEEYCCNGRVLQKNSKLSIYQIPDKGVVGINSVAGPTDSIGNGSLNDVREDLGGSPKINQVINTFTCEGSVNLGCYGCNQSPVNSSILIKPRGNPCLEFNGETIFEGGCYIFVTSIFISIFRDWELMFEWIARNMVMLGACRNVFSHRFNNNWVNGVLYAFPFKNEVKYFTAPTDSPPNYPVAKYCTDVIMYHNTSRSFYYRCSPYNPITGTFSGKLNYPTTIMDLGPRSAFLQELIMSDVYDGYLVNKLDTTTYSHVDEILNLFIVSRFMNNNFLNNALGALNIFAYFQNSRNGKFLIDADYAQLISINSELGVNPFQSSNYPDAPTLVTAGRFVTGIQYKITTPGTTLFTSIGSPNNTAGTTFIATGVGSGTGTANVFPEIQNPIFFDCDNSLGIFFSSDTQLRDYITPKRTIINSSGNNSNPDCVFNNFPVYSQQVPLSQWSILTDTKGSIFGGESNDWNYDTIYSSKYQSLDRLSPPSRYFRTTNQSQVDFFKGYIYAVTEGNSLTPSTPGGSPMQNNSITALVNYWDRNQSDEQNVTVGAPFHFYFGLKRGSSSFDRFRTKWINNSNIIN
jgi:hypothetical protein